MHPSFFISVISKFYFFKVSGVQYNGNVPISLLNSIFSHENISPDFYCLSLYQLTNCFRYMFSWSKISSIGWLYRRLTVLIFSTNGLTKLLWLCTNVFIVCCVLIELNFSNVLLAAIKFSSIWDSLTPGIFATVSPATLLMVAKPLNK